MMLSPLTMQPSTKKLRVLSPAIIAARWHSELGIDVGCKFKDLDIIEHWLCCQTGLEWYTPNEAAGDAQLYAQLERLDWYYMKDKWEFQEALSQLNHGDRVLEIGAGVGYFLAAARNRGVEVAGVELNPSAASAAIAAGFTVYQEDLINLSQRFGQIYDMVCSFQVLEHVTNPRFFLEGMLGLLRNGGKLVLSVPNDSVMRVIDPELQELLNQPPHHMSHWTENVFCALQEVLPIRLVHVKREPLQPYHVNWFVSSFGTRLRKAVGRHIGILLVNQFALRQIQKLLNLGLRRLIPGHTILVIYEKRI